MPEPRVVIQLRVSKTALDLVDKRAEANDQTRAETLRAMLKYAEQHMPKGEKP